MVVEAQSPLYTGWEPCASLEQLRTYADNPLGRRYRPFTGWKAPKVPASEFVKVLGTAAAFPRTETGYNLFYSPKATQWRITCPAQSGTDVNVQFGTGETPPGFLKVGTIHTHPEMGAFWSGTDLADQRRQLGLHVVLGLKGGRMASALCSLFTRGAQVDLPLWDVFEEVDVSADYSPVGEWEETVKGGAHSAPAHPDYVQDTVECIPEHISTEFNLQAGLGFLLSRYTPDELHMEIDRLAGGCHNA